MQNLSLHKVQSDEAQSTCESTLGKKISKPNLRQRECKGITGTRRGGRRGGRTIKQIDGQSSLLGFFQKVVKQRHTKHK